MRVADLDHKQIPELDPEVGVIRAPPEGVRSLLDATATGLLQNNEY